MIANFFTHTSFFLRKNAVMLTTQANPVTMSTIICTTGHHTAALFIFKLWSWNSTSAAFV